MSAYMRACVCVCVRTSTANLCFSEGSLFISTCGYENVYVFEHFYNAYANVCEYTRL